MFYVEKDGEERQYIYNNN